MAKAKKTAAKKPAAKRAVARKLTDEQYEALAKLLLGSTLHVGNLAKKKFGYEPFTDVDWEALVKIGIWKCCECNTWKRVESRMDPESGMCGDCADEIDAANDEDKAAEDEE